MNIIEVPEFDDDTLKVGRKALKLSAVVDQHGMPHGLACHPGNKPDVVLFEPCLRNMLTHLESVPMYADRG